MKKYLLSFFGGDAKLRFDDLEVEEEVRERHLANMDGVDGSPGAGE
jgi:hypothetical protein